MSSWSLLMWRSSSSWVSISISIDSICLQERSGGPRHEKWTLLYTDDSLDWSLLRLVTLSSCRCSEPQQSVGVLPWAGPWRRGSRSGASADIRSPYTPGTDEETRERPHLHNHPSKNHKLHQSVSEQDQKTADSEVSKVQNQKWIEFMLLSKSSGQEVKRRSRSELQFWRCKPNSQQETTHTLVNSFSQLQFIIITLWFFPSETSLMTWLWNFVTEQNHVSLKSVFWWNGSIWERKCEVSSACELICALTTIRDTLLSLWAP